jgi:hypothetical protein
MSHLLTNFDGAPIVRSQALSPRWRAALRQTPVTARARSVLMLACLAVLPVLGAAIAQETHSNPWLLTWISPMCCVTNDCCWEVSERELRSMPEDQWEVISTGQVRKRTDWSPDGRFYRCACDYNASEGKWIRHQGANTRCLFVPMRSVGLTPLQVAAR